MKESARLINEGADKLDPLALKEFLGRLSDAMAKNESLGEANRELEARLREAATAEVAYRVCYRIANMQPRNGDVPQCISKVVGSGTRVVDGATFELLNVQSRGPSNDCSNISSRDTGVGRRAIEVEVDAKCVGGPNDNGLDTKVTIERLNGGQWTVVDVVHLLGDVERLDPKPPIKLQRDVWIRVSDNPSESKPQTR